jgi:hypothetical protein
MGKLATTGYCGTGTRGLRPGRGHRRYSCAGHGPPQHPPEAVDCGCAPGRLGAGPGGPPPSPPASARMRSRTSSPRTPTPTSPPVSPPPRAAQTPPAPCPTPPPSHAPRSAPTAPGGSAVELFVEFSANFSRAAFRSSSALHSSAGARSGVSLAKAASSSCLRSWSLKCITGAPSGTNQHLLLGDN